MLDLAVLGESPIYSQASMVLRFVTGSGVGQYRAS